MLLAEYATAIVAMVEDVQDYSQYPERIRALGKIVAKLDRQVTGWEGEAGTVIENRLRDRGIE